MPTTNSPSDSAPTIPGYTYGMPEAARSPLALGDLIRLKQTVGMTEDDERYLRMAAEVLEDQADAMVDAWRAHLGAYPHLAAYSQRPDATPNPDYAAATKPRFVQWVLDACTRPYDQDWLDYQEEIGLRHNRAKKNATDGADSLEHIPMRYLVAFGSVVIVTTRDFLCRKGHSPRDVDRMHAAWTKAVMLAVTVWTRPYVSADDW